jgi:hypothetical protein
LNKAKKHLNLPGGEMLVKEQGEIIDMLGKLRDHKQCVPDKFQMSISFSQLCSTRQQLPVFNVHFIRF